MLYQINDLRVVVETAKRLLTKEQMDKKSGQATTSSFMKVRQENSKSKNKAWMFLILFSSNVIS